LRLWRRRKAVSPVIATILLIALTVTAAAIVYFVVVP
jgi:flagellin-like protein